MSGSGTQFKPFTQLLAAELDAAFAGKLDLVQGGTITGPVVCASGASWIVPPGTLGTGSPGQVRYNSATAGYEVWSAAANAFQQISTQAAGVVAPGAPTALVAGTSTTTAVPLSWSAPATGTSVQYQAQYRISGSLSWLNWGSQQAVTATTVSGLMPGLRYDFQVVAMNSAGSAPSAVTSATTLAVAPSAPGTPVASGQTSNTITLTWAASTGTAPIFYQPQYRLSGGSSWTSFGSQITGTSVVLTGLTPASVYQFQIVASNNSGTPATSPIGTGSTTAASTQAPGAVVGLAAGSATQSSIPLSWTAPATGTAPFSYVVSFRVTGTQAFTTFATIATPSTTVTGLLPGASYDLLVYAANSAGNSAFISTPIIASTLASPTTGSGVSGAQNSGATAPVIAGPFSGYVQVKQPVPVTGITVTDAAAATAPGTCIVNLSCTAGKLSLTDQSGAQIAGSGTASIQYTNTLAALQAAVATLVYTAPAGALTDIITVQVYDMFGSHNVISISIAVSAPSSGGGGGSVPTDSSGPTAQHAGAFLASLGVNLHIDFQVDGYQNLASLENNLNYLGVKLFRDSPENASDLTWWAQVAQVTNGKFLAYIGEVNPTGYQAQLSTMQSMVAGGYIWGFEGPNEPDSWALNNGANVQNTLQAAANFMPTLYAAATAAGVFAVQTSFGGDGWTQQPAADYGSTGDLSAYATYGNAHDYPQNGASPNYGGFFSTGTIDWLNRDALLTTPGKPVAITEFGYTISGQGVTSVNQTAQAAYVIEFFLDAWNKGNILTCYYALYDDGSGNWGLFNADTTPRLAASAIQALTTLLGDAGGNALTFAPGQLNYTLAGMPTGPNAGMGGQQALFQKSDGTFWLALWNEQNLTNLTGSPVNVPNVNVTLSFGSAMTSVAVYDPLVGTTAQQTQTTVSSMTISLPPHPILVKITHP